MIFRHEENIFDLYPDLIVHPVHCTGVCHDFLSGKLKKIAPDYYRNYLRACMRKKIEIGTAVLFEQPVLFGSRYIIQIAIKVHWREKVQPETAQKALASMSQICENLHIENIAIPHFEGAPQGWLQKELARLFEASKLTSLKEIYLFSEPQ